MDSEAEARGYKTHEFGDSAFILHSGRNARFRASLEANAEPRVTADLLLAQSAVARSSTGASR
jgi:hypothetical protein